MTGVRVPALDGVRGLAILLVLLAHATGLLTAGMVGVLTFFVLSGYLISSILLREHDATGRIALPRFYVRRALRLVPALVVLLAVLVVAALVPALGLSWSQVARYLAIGVFYLTDFTLGLQIDQTPPIAHLWTLAVEEQFYLLWPASLVLLLRVDRRRRGRMLVGLLLLGALARVLTVALAPTYGLFAYVLPTTWADSLLLGAAVAIVRHDQPALWARLATAAHGPLLLLAVATLVGASLVTEAYWSAATYALGVPVLAGCVAILVTHAATVEPERSSVLTSTAMRWLGDHSYSLYLYNSFVIVLMRRVIDEEGLAIALGMSLAIVLAILSRRYVEEPFLRLKERSASPPSQTPEHRR